jgi:hypothetical protein
MDRGAHCLPPPILLVVGKKAITKGFHSASFERLIPIQLAMLPIPFNWYALLTALDNWA